MNKVMGLRISCRLDDFRFGGLRTAKGDIFANRGRKQNGVLHDKADLAAQGVDGVLAGIVAIDQNVTLTWDRKNGRRD